MSAIEPAPNPVPQTRPADGVVTMSWLSYGLHLIVAVAAVVPGLQVGVGLLIVAFVIDLVMKGDAPGTYLDSHFGWRIRSVIWAGILYVVTSPLFLLLFLPGLAAWGLISLWFLYRIIRGMLALSEKRPV